MRTATTERAVLRLDVGPGQKPIGRADVLVERYLGEDNRQRAQDMAAPAPHQRLVQADIAALPFADQSFVFVWAICILEHLADPAAGADELARVARDGLVACPHPTRELEIIARNDKHYHRWIVEWSARGLVFHARQPWVMDHIRCRATPPVRMPAHTNGKMTWTRLHPGCVHYCGVCTDGPLED